MSNTQPLENWERVRSAGGGSYSYERDGWKIWHVGDNFARPWRVRKPTAEYPDLPLSYRLTNAQGNAIAFATAQAAARVVNKLIEEGSHGLQE